MKQLNWENLKTNLCPRCGEELSISGKTAMHSCLQKGCGFRATHLKVLEAMKDGKKEQREKSAEI